MGYCKHDMTNQAQDWASFIQTTRYTQRSFPPYRFIPGRHPHPTASPQGHSYVPPGHEEPQPVYVPPERWRESEDYLYGCDLYNHAYWWEAHEAWEGLWRLTPKGSAQRHLIQSLIQVAAAQLKIVLGRTRAALDLQESSSQHLALAMELAEQPRFMGLNLAEWRRSVVHYFELVLDPEPDPPTHRPDHFPYCLPT